MQSTSWLIGVDEVGRAAPKRGEPRPTRWIVGVDEVGRGALAGPVVVAAVAVPVDSSLPVVDKDSKRLLPHQREKITKMLRAHPRVVCATASAGHHIIDRVNITRAGNLAVKRVLDRISQLLSANSGGAGYRLFILLDGGLVAPLQYRQVTVIRGDAQLSIVAAASIVAKVSRDRTMTRYHRRFPQYAFNEHKGYATAAHYRALRAYGPVRIHRKTFRLS